MGPNHLTLRPGFSVGGGAQERVLKIVKTAEDHSRWMREMHVKRLG